MTLDNVMEWLESDIGLGSFLTVAVIVAVIALIWILRRPL